MTDAFKIDGHKLVFHPREVSQWLRGEEMHPLYVEISPSGACNHRCTFCALDYLGYEPRFLDAEMLKRRLSEMGRLGVKSIMYGGEGEPLLHRDIGDIIVSTKQAGIDAAITTNGTLLSRALFQRIAGSVSWIKVSMDAGTPETYAAVHRTAADDFDRVLNNLAAAVEVLRQTGAPCTLGAQMVLLPENVHEVEKLTDIVKGIGLRYIAIKPHSQHHKSMSRAYEKFDYAPFLDMGRRLEAFNDEHFTVVFRGIAMRKARSLARGYERCLALPFWTYIASDGRVWGCSAYLGDERFLYGSMYDNTFEEVWSGALRRRCLEMACAGLDTADCRVNCRMDEVNRYLWTITHPSEHVNFI